VQVVGLGVADVCANILMSPLTNIRMLLHCLHVDSFGSCQSFFPLASSAKHQDARVGSGVPRALSMPSVRDVGRAPKPSTSTQGLKSKCENQDSSGERSTG
jgi:hypothetical protein